MLKEFCLKMMVKMQTNFRPNLALLTMVSSNHRKRTVLMRFFIFNKEQQIENLQPDGHGNSLTKFLR